MLASIPTISDQSSCRNSSLHPSKPHTYLRALVLQASVLFDLETLHNDILSALSSDPVASIHLSTSGPPDSQWSIDADGFLHLDGRIFVPDSNNLQLQVLWYKHNHSLSGHFGQNRTLELTYQTRIHLARTPYIHKEPCFVLHDLHLC